MIGILDEAGVNSIEEQSPASPLRRLGPALLLHLPGESFIEYQLKAQQARKDAFVCTASYGDGGMGYIPTDKAFFEGGYEPSVALAAPCEEMLTKAIVKVLGGR